METKFSNFFGNVFCIVRVITGLSDGFRNIAKSKPRTNIAIPIAEVIPIP